MEVYTCEKILGENRKLIFKLAGLILARNCSGNLRISKLISAFMGQFSSNVRPESVEFHYARSQNESDNMILVIGVHRSNPEIRLCMRYREGIGMGGYGIDKHFRMHAYGPAWNLAEICNDLWQAPSITLQGGFEWHPGFENLFATKKVLEGVFGGLQNGSPEPETSTISVNVEDIMDQITILLYGPSRITDLRKALTDCYFAVELQ